MELNDRAKAYEKKFANTNELEFQARTRAYRRLIRWVAEDQMKMDTNKAQAFCDEMILLMVRNPDQTAFFTELQNRADQQDITLSPEQFHKIYQENLARARQDMKLNEG